jgi:ABC-type ATPase involved in cell division
MADAPLLTLRGVSVDFDGYTAIENLTLSVSRGEFVVLHGSTGSGKSTILKLIAGLVQPSEGSVTVAGDRVDLFDAAQRRWLRRSMGLMLPEGALLPDRSVLDNVMLPTLAAEENYSEARRRAMLALTKCGIADLADLRPSMLSGGQLQLAALARAVVNRPVLILADEPAAHLDEANSRTLINLLGAFSAAGVTVIVASHQHLAPEGVRSREITLSSAVRENMP